MTSEHGPSPAQESPICEAVAPEGAAAPAGGAPAPADGSVAGDGAPAEGVHAPADGEVTSDAARADGAPARADGEVTGDAAPADSAPARVDGAVTGDAATVAGDLEELATRAAERDEYLGLAQRTQADFDNYRKRVAREASSALARGTANLARELLPALDNLDRALTAVADEAGQLVEGMRLVRSELHGALARAGIEAFEPSGEKFDPELHEAVAQQPVEGAEQGTVVEVYQAGYRLSGGALIRPARVLVAG